MAGIRIPVQAHIDSKDLIERFIKEFEEKKCVTCGWYAGKGQCAKRNHRACLDWEAMD